MHKSGRAAAAGSQALEKWARAPARRRLLLVPVRHREAGVRAARPAHHGSTRQGIGPRRARRRKRGLREAACESGSVPMRRRCTWSRVSTSVAARGIERDAIVPERRPALELDLWIVAKPIAIGYWVPPTKPIVPPGALPRKHQQLCSPTQSVGSELTAYRRDRGSRRALGAGSRYPNATIALASPRQSSSHSWEVPARARSIGSLSFARRRSTRGCRTSAVSGATQ